MAEDSSRLLNSSEDFRSCSIAKNSCHYVPSKQYCAGVPDTMSDGDNRGRDPQDGGDVGTQIDIKMRESLLAKNADRYTPGNEYTAGVVDTISDGDNRGRDSVNGGETGTNKDIEMRNKLMAKNANGYTFGNQYRAGVSNTIADGDGKGREPQQLGEDAGTCIDFASRNCSLIKNSNLYTKNRQYGFGNGTV